MAAPSLGGSKWAAFPRPNRIVVGDRAASPSRPWARYSTRNGTPITPRNLSRTWERLRAKAQKQHRVRPLKLHATRHTWATFALQAGKSIRWVADVLGHADPALTLRVYAHAMREEETDLSFAEFRGGTARHYTAPTLSERTSDLAKYAESLARREGF